MRSVCGPGFLGTKTKALSLGSLRFAQDDRSAILSMNSRPKFLTTHEVAAFLGRSPETIVRWIRRNEIRGVKIGRRWFVAEDDLREWANRKTVENLGQPQRTRR